MQTSGCMDKKRQRNILLAAERLVIHYGVSKTTVSDIAREARVGVGSVYLEFTSKDEILAALAREKHHYVLERMRLAAESKDTFEERFKAMMTARVEAFIQIAEPGAHATELVHCGCDAVSREFEAFQRAQLELIGAVLTGIEEGDHSSLATTVIRAYATFTPPALYNQRFSSLLQELDAMHRLVLKGILNS